MKGYFTLLFSCFLFLNSFCLQTSVLTGVLPNEPSAEVFLHIVPTDYSSKFIQLETKVNDGIFRFDFAIEERTEAAFVFQQITIPILLTPGDSLHLEMSLLENESTIVWSGSSAAENHFFLQYALFSNPLLDYLKQAELFQSGDAKAYKQLVKNSEKKRLEFIKNFEPQNMPMPAPWAVQWLQTKVRYETAQALLDFPREYALFNRGKKLKLPESYYDFLQNIHFGQEDLLTQISYRNFILTWFNEYLQGQANYDWVYSGFPKEQFKYAGKKLMRTDRTYVQYMILKDVNHWNYKTLEKEMSAFLRSDAPNTAKEAIREKWNKLSATYEGDEIPNFEFLTRTGEKVYLSDYKGKVIYMDFWATWCKPCLMEIPWAKDLQQQLKEEPNIVFLNISVDRGAEKWKSWLAENEPESDEKSIHVQPSKESMEDIRYRWSSRGIPFYIIVNQEGKIVDENAKRPSSSKIVYDLRKVLKVGDL